MESIINGDFNDLFDEEKAKEESPSISNVSMDMWGVCNPSTFISNTEKTILQKPLLIALLREVLDVCSAAGVMAFVYGGTALGVFRENGHMIPHDYDADLATLEYPDASSYGSFLKLARFCLASGIQVSGIGAYTSTSLDSTISADFGNSFSRRRWLYIEDGELQEESFDGSGGKRVKFTFTPKGLRRIALSSPLLCSSEIDDLDKGIFDVHVDIFTLSPHPEAPENCLMVNWQKSGVYDCLKKRFARSDIFPLKKEIFEGLAVLAPANLERYLSMEYGYLGRDAMYDCNKQKYVKIPQSLLAKLPESYHKYILEGKSGQSLT